MLISIRHELDEIYTCMIDDTHIDTLAHIGVFSTSYTCFLLSLGVRVVIADDADENA